MQWEFNDTKAIRDYAEDLRVTSPEYLSNQLKRLIVMGKEYLPKMTIAEATLLVESLNGIAVPKVGAFPTGHLDQFLADLVADRVADLVAHGVAHSGSTHSAFVRSISSLDPLQAYLLLVAVECFWLHRELKLSEPPDFKFYFNIII